MAAKAKAVKAEKKALAEAPATPKGAKKVCTVGYKTWVAKPGEVKQRWFIVDAKGQTLGRIASPIAMRLMGKDRPSYTRHTDTGDFIVVVNAEKVEVQRRKRENKIYRHWTGFLGGVKKFTFNERQERDPEGIIEDAVRRMLPKNLLAKQMLKKLKIYKGTDHPHTAQKPEAWNPVPK